METNVTNFHEKVRESPGLALATTAAVVEFGPQVPLRVGLLAPLFWDGSDDLLNDTGIICSKKDVVGVSLSVHR